MAGWFDFVNGQTLPASQVQDYLMDQSVMVFADETARNAALGDGTDGMTVYLVNRESLYNLQNGVWVQMLDTTNAASLLATYVPTRSNAILNSAFDIWQRGTSFSVGTNRIYTADRWNGWRGALVAGMTVSRQSSGLTGFQYAARIQRDSGNTSTQQIRFAQDFESVSSIPLANQNVTVSFYARAGANYSQASNGLQVQVVTGTGTDQNIINGYTGSSSIIQETATLTTSWQRFSYTGTVGSSATQVGLVYNFTPVGTAGAADYYEITGVQLEAGSVATPFVRAGGTLAGELENCQRYFMRLGAGAVGRANAATVAEVFLNFPTRMRTTPTMAFGGNFTALEVNTAGRTVTNAALNAAGDTGAWVGLTSSGMTSPNMMAIQSDNNLLFSAEL